MAKAAGARWGRGKQPSELYDHLRGQFSDLSAAKRWVRAWNQAGQPLVCGVRLTRRAMAMRASLVLEGQTEAEAEEVSSYLDTKHGSALFHSM